MIVDCYQLDIPALTEEGIQIDGGAIGEVKELHCSSRIIGLLITEMLMPLLDSFERRVHIC